LDECIKFYRERYEKKSVEETKLIDGIPELLESLKDKTLVVATVKLTRFSEELLADFKIKDYFDRIVGSEVIQKELTKSTIVKKVLGEIKTNSAVIVGDTKYDIDAGRENGIFTIGVTWGIGSEEELRKAGADFIVHSPKEIENIVK
jgi:phosphoglycolate phosphatase